MEFKDLISPLLTALGMFFGALVIAWKFGLLVGKVDSQHKETLGKVESQYKETMSSLVLMGSEIRGELNIGLLKVNDEIKHVNYRMSQVETARQQSAPVRLVSQLDENTDKSNVNR